MFYNNSAYFPNNVCQVNWSLTYHKTGAIEKHFKARQYCANM